MPVVNDTRSSQNIPAQEVSIDIKKDVILAEKYNPMDTPLLTMAAAKGRIRTVSSPEFKIMIESEIPRNLLTTAYNAGTKTATLTAGHVDRVRIDDVVMVVAVAPTGVAVLQDNAVVTAVNSGSNTVSFSKDLALLAGGGDMLFVSNSASADATRSRLSLTNDLGFDENYIQIFKDAIEIGEELENTATYEQNVLKRYKQSSIRQHKHGINFACWFNAKAKVSVNGKTRRIMGGINYLLDNITPVTDGGVSYKKTFSSDITTADADVIYQNIFKRGTGNKVAFCNSYMLSQFNKMVQNDTNSRYSIDSKTEMYGVKIKTLVSPFGNIDLIYEKNFDGVFNGAYILDMGLINFNKLQNLGTKLKTNVQDPDFAGKKDEIRSYVSFEIAVPEAHAVLRYS